MMDPGMIDSDSDAADKNTFTHKVNSHSNEDSLIQTASVSSTSSSIRDGRATDIRFVEEGIDYHKTPKPLLYLKMSMVFLFTSLVVLASV